ncbi:hypothetical protein RZS08_25430 [Arthrospira platensis SPKY1]|nr:hypothetical protein [Arthrospira platensis SPKY1]
MLKADAKVPNIQQLRFRCINNHKKISDSRLIKPSKPRKGAQALASTVGIWAI